MLRHWWIGSTTSPLTDLRALCSSFLVHALVLVGTSLAVLGVARPPTSDTSHMIRGELGPVDNRAPEDEGGGEPGELGGVGALPHVSVADASSAMLSDRGETVAEQLLAEALRAPSSVEAAEPPLPGPWSGLGTLPGPGLGGGGGSGGGSGTGSGGGIGAGTRFFGAEEVARSFIYVIDCSGSMAIRNSLEVAKRELLASLDRLPPETHFGVVFYNLRARVLTDPSGQPGLMAATSGNKSRVRTQLANVQPDGGTDHMRALHTALELQPEVVFFLTDGDMMSMSDVQKIQSWAGESRIQIIEFGIGPYIDSSNPLRTLAVSTGGSYRYIDVTTFPKTSRR